MASRSEKTPQNTVEKDREFENLLRSATKKRASLNSRPHSTDTDGAYLPIVAAGSAAISLRYWQRCPSAPP